MIELDTKPFNLKDEVELLAVDLIAGDPCASTHMARVIEADNKRSLYPFAEALAARLRDHLERWAELGVTDPEQTLEDDVYQLLKTAAIDWNGRPCRGRPGEEV